VETSVKWQPRHKGEQLKSGFFHREIHYSDDPARDDDWVRRESPRYGGVTSAKWRREQEIDWDVFGGERVWPMLSRQFHNSHIILNEDQAIYRIIDHGIRHPTCCLWCAVNRKGDRHFFREYYATDKSVALNAREIVRLSSKEEVVLDTYIDPSTLKRVNFQTTDPSADKKGLTSLIELYISHGIPCSLADNSSAGYDKVTNGLLSTLARESLRTGQLSSYLTEMKINQEGLLLLADKPAITFDLRCTDRAFREVENLRWKEVTGDETQRAEPEKTVDVEDEGPDCVRYAMQSNLFWRTVPTVFHPDSYMAQLTKRHYKRKYKSKKKWA
jgi:hypothetical protein